MVSDSFSLMQGGPVYRAMHRLGWVRQDLHTAPLVAVALVAIAFAPMLVLCALAGTALPSTMRVNLLGDYAVLARLLVAMPVLVVFAAPSDEVLQFAMRHVGRAGLVPDTSRGPFEALLRRTHALRDSTVPELACAIVAVGSAFWTTANFSHVPGFAHWAIAADGGLSNAGAWFAWVAAPVFRFVGLIWIWRFLLWTYVLWRLPRVRLALHATHPDGAAGLGVLSPTQARFAIMSFAAGCIIGGDVLVRMVHGGASIKDVQWELLAFVAGSTVVVVAPLLLLMPLLVRVRRHGLRELGALGQRLAQDFDDRWTHAKDPGGEALIDSPNPSTIADFTAMHANARGMSVLPVNRLTLVAIAGFAALPLLPAVLHAISIEALLQRLFGILA